MGSGSDSSFRMTYISPIVKIKYIFNYFCNFRYGINESVVSECRGLKMISLILNYRHEGVTSDERYLNYDRTTVHWDLWGRIVQWHGDCIVLCKVEGTQFTACGLG